MNGYRGDAYKIIEQISQEPAEYTVECPGQIATSMPTKQRYKVRFDTNICNDIFKNKGRYYFKHEDYLLGKRNSNIRNIPKERRKIRPNVEALMKEFKARTQGGKTKVRGQFKTSLFAFNTGIAINFGRIFRYIIEYELFNNFLLPIALLCMKRLPKNNPMAIFTRKPDRCQSNFELIRDYSKYFSNSQAIAA